MLPLFLIFGSSFAFTLPALKGQELVDFVNKNQNLFKAKFHGMTIEEEHFYTIKLPIKRSNKFLVPEVDVIQDADIPSSFDSRTNWPDCPTISAVHEQANCGSCWAVSSASVISDRTCIASEGKVQIEASAADILSCCKDCGTGCNGGVPLMAMEWWHTHGVVTGGDFSSGTGCKPYPFGCPCYLDYFNETTPACSSSCTNQAYPLSYDQDKHFGSLYYELPPTVSGIQKEIMAHGPVVTCFEQYADFNTYQSGIYVHTAGAYIGLHCVKVLGWGSDNGTPYWLATNSRGTNFGEDGFFRFLRGVDECGFEAVMAAGRPKL